MINLSLAALDAATKKTTKPHKRTAVDFHVTENVVTKAVEHVMAGGYPELPPAPTPAKAPTPGETFAATLRQRFAIGSDAEAAIVAFVADEHRKTGEPVRVDTIKWAKQLHGTPDGVRLVLNTLTSKGVLRHVTSSMGTGLGFLVSASA